jgi:ferredoxin-type protein NapF
MTAELSRRGLFRAFRGEDAQRAEPAAPQLVARISDACVEPKGVTCRRCGDECDARAISFRPIGGGKARVSLDAAACTGCQACTAVCPANAIEMIAAERAALIAGLVQIGTAS